VKDAAPEKTAISNAFKTTTTPSSVSVVAGTSPTSAEPAEIKQRASHTDKQSTLWDICDIKQVKRGVVTIICCTDKM
jgi:hypothetical protein